MKRWVAVAVVLLVLLAAAPVWGADGTDLLTALQTKVTDLEKRVATLEAEGFAKINKSDVGTATVDKITVKILSVTAGPHGTIVAVRIQNGGAKTLEYSRSQSVLVAGEKQLKDPVYRYDFTNDEVLPGAYADLVMVYDPLPAGTKTIKFVPSLRWEGDFMNTPKVTVEGKL